MTRQEQEKDREFVNKTDLEMLLSRFDACPLECDGMTRVLHTVLEQSAIPHETWIGGIRDTSGNHAFFPHFWITVGQFRIDYRARMWLGEREDVPHGVVRLGEYPKVRYEGKKITLTALSDDLFHVLTMENPFKDFPFD